MAGSCSWAKRDQRIGGGVLKIDRPMVQPNEVVPVKVETTVDDSKRQLNGPGSRETCVESFLAPGGD